MGYTLRSALLVQFHHHECFKFANGAIIYIDEMLDRLDDATDAKMAKNNEFRKVGYRPHVGKGTQAGEVYFVDRSNPLAIKQWLIGRAF